MSEKKRSEKTPSLYLPKRSTLLVFCFILSTLTSAQYHIIDGVMDMLIRDEVASEFLKYDQFIFEMAVHFGFLIAGPLTGAFVVKSGQAKSTIILGFIISSLATFYCPIAATNLFSISWSRAIAGAGQAMVIIGMYQLIAFWIPKQEYTRAITFLASGYYSGMMFSNLWSAVLCKVYSWQATFYWFSIVPLLFLGFWSYVVSGSPSSHPKITNIELSYLRANAVPSEGQSLYLRKLFYSRDVWILFLSTILFQFAHTGIFSVISFFVVDVLWIDVTFGVLTVMVLYYNVSAMVFDYFLKLDKQDATGKNSRKLREAVGAAGLLGCAIFLKLFCGSGHTTAIRLTGFFISLAFLVNAYAGHVSAMLDVIPRHAALIIGLSYIPSSFLNIWAHVGLRWVLDTTGNWSFVLSSIAAALSFSGIIWGVFGTTDRLIT